MEQIPCQACRIRAVEATVESDEPQNPYRVCRACAHRLKTLSLRPLEWYNLASCHSPYQFLLHDDFYDQDGTGCQPEEDIVDAESFPAPALEEVIGDLEQLLDYASTRWFIDEAIVKALGRHSKDSVLRSLETRVAFTQTRVAFTHSLEVAYEICARALGRTAEKWIRKEWESFTPSLLHSLARASAACLPREEGFRLVVNAIADVPHNELVRVSWALSWFRSQATLDWIERNICDPLVEDWGRLAAVSNLKWERVAKWLASGRPLSLVALDALIACWSYNTPMLKGFAPKLLEPATVNEMSVVLNHYLDSDSAPRVRKAVVAVLGNWENILISQPDI